MQPGTGSLPCTGRSLPAMTRASSTLTIDGQEFKLSVVELIDVKEQLENLVRGKGFGLLTLTGTGGDRTIYVNQGTRLSIWEPR